MPFRIRNEAKDFFKFVDKDSSEKGFNTDFDILYFCFMAGILQFNLEQRCSKMKLARFVREMKKIENEEHKVVRVSETEFELENGDVYPIPFELDYTPTVEEFQKFVNDSKILITEFVKKSEKEEKDARKRQTPQYGQNWRVA